MNADAAGEMAVLAPGAFAGRTIMRAAGQIILPPSLPPGIRPRE